MRALMIAVMLVTMLGPVRLTAGTTGSLVGTVTNLGSGAPLADVTIVVSSPVGRQQTTTDVHGNFGFVSLAPGSYTVAANKSGYTSADSAVYVDADASIQMSLQLHPLLRTISVIVAAPSGAVVRTECPGTIGAPQNVVMAANATSAIAASIRRKNIPVWVDGYVLTMATVRPGTTADVYQLYPQMPFYSFDGTDIYALHFVPGLTFGAGLELAR